MPICSRFTSQSCKVHTTLETIPRVSRHGHEPGGRVGEGLKDEGSPVLCCKHDLSLLDVLHASTPMSCHPVLTMQNSAELAVEQC